MDYGHGTRYGMESLVPNARNERCLYFVSGEERLALAPSKMAFYLLSKFRNCLFTDRF
jgi:hypothetical protein